MTDDLSESGGQESAEQEKTEQRDPLDLLIEQFLLLHRKGEPVTVEVFAEQHPEQREQLVDLLPTLLALEDVKRDRASSGSGQSRVSLPALERLGDFRIEGELGRGGMGVVFAAVQESLDRRVALKVLPQASLLTGNQLERFQREAQIAARLHHSNIVPVYGSGESDGYHWYAMQHLSGQSLDRWRQTQSGLMPEGSGAWSVRARFVARIGAAAASALHYAHGLGTMHRDIKPGNFLLDQDDHLWVTDFGLAKALESEGLTNSGDLLGTLQYMAPEQFAGDYDVRSEVYALGVTLYELLTLHHAFHGRHRSELIENVRSQKVEALTRAVPDVPLDLAIIVSKAMAREPQDRYQDAEALEQDLEAFLEDRPIRARRLSSVATLWRWCRRNRGFASLAAGTAAAVLLAAVTGWFAYVVTGDALEQATTSGTLAKNEGARAEANLQLSLAAFGNVFDALVGREASLGFEEDPDTGEQTVIVQAPVSPRDVVLLRQMLEFYDQFASTNAQSQSLRYETARAYRRVGAIHTRLGEPESLLEADAAFEKALAGLEGITDRNVARDLATLRIDIGHLRERQHRPQSASESFGHALVLLDQLADARSAASRLERASVLFELSRTKRSQARRGRGRDRNRDRGRSRRGHEELQQAQSILAELAAENAQDDGVRSLQARVWMEGALSFGASENAKKALAVWRELVAQHPDRTDYNYQLCEALLARGVMRPRPQTARPLGPKPQGSRREGSREQRLLVLREADAAAERLFRAQPLFREGRAMLLRVRARYGRELHLSSNDLKDEAVVARRQQAQEILQSALQAGLGLVTGEGLGDERFMRDVIEASCWLGLCQHAQGQLEESKGQAIAALELIESQVDAFEAFRRERAATGRRETGRSEAARSEAGRGEAGRGEGSRPDWRRRPREDRQPPGPGSRPEGPRGGPPRRGGAPREGGRGGSVRLVEDLIRAVDDALVTERATKLLERTKKLRERTLRRPR